MMKWLNYEKHMHNFSFVYNKADTAASDAVRDTNMHKMMQLLEAGPVGILFGEDCESSWRPSANTADPTTKYSAAQQLDNAIDTGFPPYVRDMNAEMKADYDKLVDEIFNTRTGGKAMKIEQSMCTIL